MSSLIRAPAGPRPKALACLLVALQSLAAVSFAAEPGHELPLTQDVYRQRVGDAQRLLERNELEEAVTPLRAALDVRPDGVEALWLMSAVLFQLQRFEQGRPYIERLSELDPDSRDTRFLRGAYYEVLGVPAQAIREYRETLRLDASHRGALLHLGNLSFRVGDEATAEAALTRLVDLYPDDAEALRILGHLYAQQGSLGRALETLERAERADPESTRVHYLLGALRRDLGDLEGATEELERALRLTPEHGPSLLELGMISIARDRYPAALELLRRAEEQMPDDQWVHLHLGEVLQFQRRFESAEAAYRRVLELDPDSVPARVQLGDLYLEQGRDAEAAETLEEAVETDPDAALARYHLGRALARLGRAEAAAAQFEAALQRAPRLTEAYLAYGNLLMASGERERGQDLLVRFRELERSERRLEGLRRRLEKVPGETETGIEVVRELIGAGRFPEALEEAGRWTVRQPGSCPGFVEALVSPGSTLPDDASVWLGLGRLLLHCERGELAVDVLERAPRPGREAPRLHLLLARAYDLLGEAEKAAEERAIAQEILSGRILTPPR